MLTIRRYVIHELSKESRKTEASTTLSQALGEINEFSLILLNQVHQAYSDSTSLKNTSFVDRNDRVFKNQIEKYVDEKTDAAFYTFSEKSIKEMENQIVSEPLAIGGFYLYADYSMNGTNFIIVVLLRKKEGFNLKLVDGVYVVDPSENLNIDKIAMGFRLNMNIYSDSNDDRNFIALITNQRDKVSSYFKDWVVAAGIASDEKNSNNFIKIVKNIQLPTDDEGVETMDRDTFMKQVYDFVESNPSKLVNLKVLGAHFYGDDFSNTFISHAERNDIIIDNEFKRNSKSFKGLITIRAKVKGVELNVDYDKINRNEVDVRADMVIIRIPELIDQINQQRN